MAPRFGWLLIALLLVACTDESTPGTTPPGAQPTAVPTSNVTVDDLDGTWVFGDRSEPAAGAVVSCEVTQTLTLQQVGSVLQGSVGSGSGGRTLETLTGSNRSGQVQLSGMFEGNLGSPPEQVLYSLKFNPKTQHLVGTRNGQTFWAAPLITGIQAGCSPAPTPEASLPAGVGGTEVPQ